MNTQTTKTVHNTLQAKEIKMNANEQKIINSICNNNDSGSESKEQLKADNMTWFNQTDIQAIGFSKHQASGYMSDLEKKGLIYNSDSQEEYGWYVTDAGIDASNLK